MCCLLPTPQRQMALPLPGLWLGLALLLLLGGDLPAAQARLVFPRLAPKAASRHWAVLIAGVTAGASERTPAEGMGEGSLVGLSGAVSLSIFQSYHKRNLRVFNLRVAA